MAKKAKKAKKTRKVAPVPEGFHTLTPTLIVRDAPKAVEFYKQAFGAKVRGVHYTPDGKVMHADLKIGDSIFFFSEEFPDMKCLSPLARGGTSVTIHIYCENVDAGFNKAIAAGAKVVMPLMDSFWGDRFGQLEDPFGHRWSMGTHKEDLTKEEIEERAKAVFTKMATQAKAGS